MAYLRLPSAMLSSLGRSRLEVNIAVLGADNVGKSALTVRFLTGRFIGEYGDKESIYSHSIIIDGQEVCVNIWDSPSLHDQDLERLLGWADALLLVYSICERDTFAMLYSHRSLLRHAARRRLPPPGSRGSDGGGDQRRRRAGSLPQPGVTPTPTPAPPLLLVGNKLDLEHLRTVASGEGRALALALDASFVEVSAADDCDAGVGGGVHRALGALARDALLPLLLPLPATGIAGVDAGARGSSVSGGATGGAGAMNDGVAFVHPALHGRKGGFRGIVRSVSAVVFGRKRIHSL
ncbi:ras-related and estrogen-regulated growth inhibitor-like protein [Lethenteron reissneri]|uniref:ras-related and estrogen-regulated growth inhibitor-like protein n=1 Tax=Lethenteron reissneri TaxID=7753 RepID=UPI002AB6EFFD|nr:ras-related and estrogen-regulated growth inhibitor-like protein [Lethenteron reissneri]